MAYSLPSFNLLCNIYTKTALTVLPAPRIANVPCNLAHGRRVYPVGVPGVAGAAKLLLPAGTDIRDASTLGANLADTVEVPAGSGRHYVVITVDDLGKGFANEHRYAIISKTVQYGFWPAPIP